MQLTYLEKDATLKQINHCMTLEEGIKKRVKTKGLAYKEPMGVGRLCCLVGRNVGPGACALNIRRETRKKEDRETWTEKSNINRQIYRFCFHSFPLHVD